MHKTAAVLLLALATFSTTGCASMGTKRPSGGSQIQKTSNQDQTAPIGHDQTFDGRADLGQR